MLLTKITFLGVPSLFVLGFDLSKRSEGLVSETTDMQLHNIFIRQTATASAQDLMFQPFVL